MTSDNQGLPGFLEQMAYRIFKRTPKTTKMDQVPLEPTTRHDCYSNRQESAVHAVAAGANSGDTSWRRRRDTSSYQQDDPRNLSTQCEISLPATECFLIHKLFRQPCIVHSHKTLPHSHSLIVFTPNGGRMFRRLIGHFYFYFRGTRM